MSRRATLGLAALAAGVLATSGCGVHYGTYDTWAPRTALEAQPWSEHTAYFHSFERMDVVDQSAGVQAVALTSEITPWVLEAAQQALPFHALSRSPDLATPPEFVLQGTLSYEWAFPWWTMVQLVDLWIHGMIGAPTLGKRLDMRFELRLFDKEFRLLHMWTAERSKGYLGNVWWMILRGTSRLQQDQMEFVRDALEQVGVDLREHMVTPEGR